MRVVELLAVADAADNFHKKTVTASIGGGVASVAGSITTITGLALAPFTFGSSLIITAVGIGVATAGGLTSASANITDTMHSRTDRARVEQIILGYQEEIKDIRECLQFLQVRHDGMDMCTNIASSLNLFFTTRVKCFNIIAFMTLFPLTIAGIAVIITNCNNRQIGILSSFSFCPPVSFCLFFRQVWRLWKSTTSSSTWTAFPSVQ